MAELPRRRLSVAIITFNEEKNIRDCISSVSSIADDIVVLDSHSTDKTKEIALEEKKVRFFAQDFLGHIEQKNKAMELCREDWILSLDADERIDEILKAEIVSFLTQENVFCSGFKIPRLTYHLGKWITHSGWYPQKRIRLIRKGAATWSGENPHDFLDLKPGEKSGEFRGNILHFSFQDFSHQIQTINQFSSIVAYTRYQKGATFSLGKTLLKPWVKFIEIYFWKLGFLDGIPGLFIAISSSFSTFLKQAKVYELSNGHRDRPSNLRQDYGQKK